MLENLSPVAMAVLFVPAFVAFWCLVVYLISQLGGWASLAEDFRATNEPSGEAFSWTSGKIHFFSNYNNSLIATVSRTGVHVAPWMAFRIGHEPIFIPWHRVRGIIQGYYFFRPYTHLAMMTPSGEKSITLYGRRLAESIARNAPENLMRRKLG